MSSFGQWIALDFDRIAPSQVSAKAAWARQSASPYDVPTHVRTKHDREAGVLVVQFKYISDEDLIRKRIGQFAVAKIGKKTRRLFEIEFDDASYKASKGQGAAMAVKDEVAAELTSSRSLVSNAMIASRALSLSDTGLRKVSVVR